jgi:hypothetical protein
VPQNLIIKFGVFCGTFFKSALNTTNFPFGNTRYDDDLIVAIYQGTLTHPFANHEPFVWVLCILLISIIIDIYFINMLVIWRKIKPIHIQPIKKSLNKFGPTFFASPVFIFAFICYYLCKKGHKKMAWAMPLIALIFTGALLAGV